MRHVLLIACALTCFACKDTKPADDEPSGPSETSSKLERPGALPRPPGSRLPDDLRPPR